MTEITTEKRINLITQLTAGLLASGHYTEARPDGKEPTIRRIGDRKPNDWFTSYAVAAAATLLQEIESFILLEEIEEKKLGAKPAVDAKQEIIEAACAAWAAPQDSGAVAPIGPGQS